MKEFVYYFVKLLLLIVPLLLSVAFATLVERKILASIQRRRGPDQIGFIGIFQPFADGLKMLSKETIVPYASNYFLFIFSPILTFFLAILGWSVIPFGEGIVLSDQTLGVFFLFAISSLGVYGIVLAGWSSNSQYAFLGSIRSAAQMVSYEVSIGLIFLSIVVVVGSLNFTDLAIFQRHVWFIFPLLPLSALFFVSALAETNRSPFDLPEAEAELVSGYNVEYSAVGFVLFFVAEYANILLLSSVTTVLFFGGWHFPISFSNFFGSGVVITFKVLLVFFLFVWVRATLPRYRYDQLMRLGWKVFLPFILGWFTFTMGVLFGLDGLP